MLIIGLGNEFRHDDAVGLFAARLLREHGVSTEEHEGYPATLIYRWKHADGLILIDAVRSGAPPGTVHRLDVSASALNRELFKSSTHALGLADAVELSRTLGTLPAQVYVFGVEVRDLSAGLGLSPDVQRALPSLVEEVLTCAKGSPPAPDKGEGTAMSNANSRLVAMVGAGLAEAAIAVGDGEVQ